VKPGPAHFGHLLPGSHDDVRERMDAYLAAGEAADGVEEALADEHSDALTGEPTGERAFEDDLADATGELTDARHSAL
jgi:hypothetical protein